MSWFAPQNPGIGGLNELTASEEVFVMNLAGLSYQQGDILYYNGTSLTRLPAGTSGQYLKTLGAGANPIWDTVSDGGGTPAGSSGQLQYNDSGSFGADFNLNWDNTVKSIGIQVDTPKATVHSSATIGQTINDIVTGSVSLANETLPATPTGTITKIAEPSAGSGGIASYVDGGSGTAITANGNSYDFRIYPCLVVSGNYYRSQYYESVSAGTDPNDSQGYNINLSWGTVSISGETINYYVEYDINSSGSWNPVGLYSYTSETLTNLSGSNPTTSFPTFYTNSVTAPTAFTGGSASGQDVGSGAFTEVPVTVLMEVDSVKNIGGTDYVSGSPTGGSFDDTGMSSYNPEVSWTDNGNASNAVARVSQDNGSTWIYQFVGSTSSPYRFTSTSNDSTAEALWGQTYSGTGLIFTFKPYGQSSSPSGYSLYSSAGTDYSTTITDTQNYILKHTFTGNDSGKVLDETLTYGQQYVSGEFYDIGYTTWASGTLVTPTSYGFTGTAQNRDYKLYGYSPSLGIYSQVPLTLSTTSAGGSKYVSGSFTLPSGVTQLRITRQVNGGGYTHGKFLTSGTTFVDDALDTSWTVGGVSPITPTSIMGIAGRFDKASTSTTMSPTLSVVHIGGGQGYPNIGWGVATNENSDITNTLARLGVNTATGYIQAVTSRLEIGTTFGGTVSAMFGNSNVINNNQSNSSHFQVKGANDANLINTRSDMDTVAFGQAIGSDQATTVQIQPARSNDAGLVMIGHSSQTDSSTLIRFQTSAGSFTGEITVGGWLRTSTGSASNPPVSCRSDTDTGVLFPVANNLAFATGGTERVRIDNGGNVGVGTTNITSRVDINQVSLGQSVLRLRSEATNDDPNIHKYQNRIATTNNTITTIHTIATVSNNSYIVEAKVLARRTGGSAGTASDTAGYKIIGVFKNNSGTLTQVGTTTVEHSSEDQAGWDCTFSISGTNILLRGTGATNNNITWHLVDLDVSNLSS